MSSSIDTTGFNERNVSHHFASADQEFSSCKQGMWLFLLTEILLFSGLFVCLHRFPCLVSRYVR